MKVVTVGRLCLVIALAVAALRLLAPTPLELLDLKALDFRHLVRGPVAAGGEVVIVGVDETSLAEFGRWPWPRSRLATLVDRLSEASVIGFDIVFDQPETSPDPDALRAAIAAAPDRPARDLLAAFGNDARLADAFRRSGRVVLGHFFEFGGSPAPTLAAETARLPELSVRTVGGASPDGAGVLEEATRAHVDIPVLLEAAVGAGHINVLPDIDGLQRRVPLAIRVAARALPSLGLEIARRHLAASPATVTFGSEGVAGLRIGPRDLPVDAAGQLWINYLGPPRMFRHIPAADVLAGRAAPDALAGKIVLVGFTAAGFDEITTPFAPVVPGVQLQATVIDNVLHGRSLVRPWWVVPAETIAIVLVGVTLGVALHRLRTLGGTLAAAALALLYLAATQYLFTSERIVLGAVYPVAAIFLCTLGGAVFQSLTEEREKQKIRRAFGHYLNPEVTEMLAREPSRLRLGGERRDVTILFSDVRGFTGISERLLPEALSELLNEYLGAMTDVVFAHEGLLDKYVGDAVMAFWGAPIAAPDHAGRCCRAALDMLTALSALHERWRAHGLPLLEIGIGINSGEAAVGNFGSAQRFSYTAIGDDVNLASRLEGLNPQYGTRILITDSTRQVIGDEFVCREIDRLRVKGRVQSVTVHELLGRRTADGDGHLARRAEAFASALAAYRRRAWDEALSLLGSLAAEFPDDRAAASLASRCRRLKVAPPPADWDAV